MFARTTGSLRGALAALLCLLPPAARTDARDQPQWGQRYSRNMVSPETHLPESFDPATGRNIKWVAALGSESYATPIVAGGKVLMGTNNGQPRDPRHKGDRGVLMCLDERDGSLCWQLVVPKIGGDPHLDWPGSGICSSPTVEGDRVYVVSNRAEVLCLDLNGQANGNDGPCREEGRLMAPKNAKPMKVTGTDADILWRFDIRSGAGVHQHDVAHSSILLHGRFLYVNTANGIDSRHRRIPRPEAPSLIVLDKTTGRLVARDVEPIGPRIVHSTWSSPALGEVGGRTLVFLGAGDGVCYAFEALRAIPPASEPAKLKKVWSFDCDPNAPKEDVQRYVGNRRESPSNIKGMPVFHKGRVYVAAGGDIWWGKHQAWLKCIDASKTGDVTRTGLVWSYPLRRHACTTPAIHDGLVYIADCGRLVHCLDANTGKPCWTHRTGGAVWGSTLVADGKVYVGTQRGDFWVLAAGRKKKVLSSVRLDSPISGTPVAANGTLYVATLKRLYAVQEKGAANRDAPSRP